MRLLLLMAIGGWWRTCVVQRRYGCAIGRGMSRGGTGGGRLFPPSRVWVVVPDVLLVSSPWVNHWATLA